MSAADAAADEGQSTTFCPFCNIHLAFPAKATLIQCPSCSNTLDPNAPHQVRCGSCSTLLAYPPHALYIQCPQCSHTMDPRQAAPGAAGEQGGGVQQTTGKQGAPRPQAGGGSAGKAEHATAGGEAKKKRDPNMPKAVTNAYMIFCKSRRNELREKHPELPFGKIGAKLGEIWRSMSVEARKPYEDRAALDRERYRREMQDFQNGKHSASGDSKRQKVAAISQDELSEHAQAASKRKGAAKQQVEEEEDEEDEEDFASDDE